MEDAQQAIESAGRLFATRHTIVLSVWQPIADVGVIPSYAETASMLDFVELDRAAADAEEATES